LNNRAVIIIIKTQILFSMFMLNCVSNSKSDLLFLLYGSDETLFCFVRAI